MEITLDITRRFNTLVNHDYFFDGPPMNPVLFLNYPKDIRGEYQLSLMNFGLNISKEMEDEFKKYSPSFSDIIKCNSENKRIIIFNEAKFKFSGIKGADFRFADTNTNSNNEPLYYTWPYKIVEGDYQFLCGGHSPFSTHYLLCYLIGDSNARATITFSSEDYFLLDSYSSELEELASSKQKSFSIKESTVGRNILSSCTSISGKTFDSVIFNEYFDIIYKEGFHTTVAIKSEGV
jgi:hypothetical protein